MSSVQTKDEHAPVGSIHHGVVEGEVASQGVPVKVTLGFLRPTVSESDVVSELFGVLAEAAPPPLVGILEVGQRWDVSGAVSDVAAGGDPRAHGEPLVGSSLLVALTPACSLGKANLAFDRDVFVVKAPDFLAVRIGFSEPSWSDSMVMSAASAQSTHRPTRRPLL